MSISYCQEITCSIRDRSSSQKPFLINVPERRSIGILEEPFPGRKHSQMLVDLFHLLIDHNQLNGASLRSSP